MQDIKDYLSYDPLTGLFTRLKNTGTSKHNDIAGGIHSSGYVRFSYKNKKIYAHRAAWIYMYGSIPEGYHVDHLNEVKNDNRLCNLRLVTHTENQHNNSKHLGYTYRKTRDKYYVELGVNGTRVYVGYYDTPEEAHAAYVCAKREHHPFWVENK